MLLVASQYPNHAAPLWNLPGGRQRPGELLEETLRREFREETGLAVRAKELAYISESYDPRSGTHFLNATFEVLAEAEPAEAALPHDDPKLVGLDWVARAELGRRITVAVVREPLDAYLRSAVESSVESAAPSGATCSNPKRYFGFGVADVAIEFAEPA